MDSRGHEYAWKQTVRFTTTHLQCTDDDFRIICSSQAILGKCYPGAPLLAFGVAVEGWAVQTLSECELYAGVNLTAYSHARS